MKHENTIVNEYTLRSKDTPLAAFLFAKPFLQVGKKIKF